MRMRLGDKNMMKRLKFLIVTVIAVLALSVPSVSAAATCGDAGQFNSTCQVITDLFTAILTVGAILVTGENAGTIIGIVVILALIGFILDMARGKNSYLRRKFEKV